MATASENARKVLNSIKEFECWLERALFRDREFERESENNEETRCTI